MIDLPQYRPAPRPSVWKGREGYVKDRYRLREMEVGEVAFFYIPQRLITGYTQYMHKTTDKRFVTRKEWRDGIEGCAIKRVK